MGRDPAGAALSVASKRDVPADHPTERERWFAFRNERVRERRLEWLADEGIEPPAGQTDGTSVASTQGTAPARQAAALLSHLPQPIPQAAAVFGRADDLGDAVDIARELLAITAIGDGFLQVGDHASAAASTRPLPRRSLKDRTSFTMTMVSWLAC